MILLVIIVILFWILPSLLAPKKQSGIVYDVQTIPPPPEVVAQLDAKKMLDSQYETAREIVPEDYPKGSIGDCPLSKPMSTDLPLVNVPMHLVANGGTCKLHATM